MGWWTPITRPIEGVIGGAADWVESCLTNPTSAKCRKGWQDIPESLPGFSWAKEISGVIYDELGNVYDQYGDWLVDRATGGCFDSNKNLAPANMKFFSSTGSCTIIDGLGTTGGWLGSYFGDWVDEAGNFYDDAGDYVKNRAGDCFTKAGGIHDPQAKISNFGKTAGHCIPGSNWVGENIIEGGIEGITNFANLAVDELPDVIRAGVGLGAQVANGVMDLPGTVNDKIADFIKDNVPFDECAFVPESMRDPNKCGGGDAGDGTFVLGSVSRSNTLAIRRQV